jgi:hypothetical protein
MVACAGQLNPARRTHPLLREGVKLCFRPSISIKSGVTRSTSSGAQPDSPSTSSAARPYRGGDTRAARAARVRAAAGAARAARGAHLGQLRV